MLTLIKFKQLSHRRTAKIVINYEEGNNEVTVELFGCNDQFEDKIAIRQIDGIWTTDSMIAINFRATYLDILNEINWMCTHPYTKVKEGELGRQVDLN